MFVMFCLVVFISIIAYLTFLLCKHRIRLFCADVCLCTVDICAFLVAYSACELGIRRYSNHYASRWFETCYDDDFLSDCSDVLV